VGVLNFERTVVRKYYSRNIEQIRYTPEKMNRRSLRSDYN
jgi:hypothetical protein